MSISAETVSELRRQTGAGLMDAKRALEQTRGDMAQAAERLRVQGLARAHSRSAREARQGMIKAYTHSDRIGAMVELLCESDFVARSEPFRALASDLAMQVAASDPEYLTPTEVPAEVVARERKLALEEAQAAGKPESAQEEITRGKLEKFYQERCLLRQPFIKDEKKSVEELIAEVASILGEKVELRRFARFALAEE